MYLCSKEFFEMQELDFEKSKVLNGNVKGRLKKNVSFWEKIGANEYILDTLRNGYKLPLFSVPQRSISKNNKSALDNMDFVEKAVSELLKNHCVVEVPFTPHIINPLTVSINNLGKKRLILDLRKVNEHIWKEKISFEDWKVGLEYFTHDGYMFKFDLSKGYHHLDIFPSHQTFLGFSVKGKNYCFTVLPFGISSAPYIFTKVLREMVKYWRLNGIKIVMFLDDGWGSNKTFEQTEADSYFVKNSLEMAGFLINKEKSIWFPVQELEWIGIFWNSEKFCISIPQRRINDFNITLKLLLGSLPYVSARHLAKFTGKVISMMPVIGNIARLMTRYLYKEIETSKSWDFCYKLPLNHPCLTEVNFWVENLEKLNVRKLSAYNQVQTLIYSDASHLSCGSYIVDCKNSVFHSVWNNEEQAKSSTFRELRAVYLALRAYGSLLENSKVKWFSDSQSCVKIVQSGSTKLDLQLESLNIFKLCLKWNIDLSIQWVPREHNQIADDISKIYSSDEWEVTTEFFNFIDQMWGPHEVDRFASFKNRKLNRFNSLFYEYKSEAIDAFTQSWSDCNNWLVPPIYLVSRTIFHLLACKGKGTLIVPKWPSSSFWPILFKNNGVKQDFIKDILEFKAGQNIFMNKNCINCIFDSRRFNSKVLAIRLE